MYCTSAPTRAFISNYFGSVEECKERVVGGFECSSDVSWTNFGFRSESRCAWYQSSINFVHHHFGSFLSTPKRRRRGSSHLATTQRKHAGVYGRFCVGRSGPIGQTPRCCFACCKIKAGSNQDEINERHLNEDPMVGTNNKEREVHKDVSDVPH